MATGYYVFDTHHEKETPLGNHPRPLTTYFAQGGSGARGGGARAPARAKTRAGVRERDAAKAGEAATAAATAAARASAGAGARENRFKNVRQPAEQMMLRDLEDRLIDYESFWSPHYRTKN